MSSGSAQQFCTRLMREPTNGFRYYENGSAFEYEMVRWLYSTKRKLDVIEMMGSNVIQAFTLDLF